MESLGFLQITSCCLQRETILLLFNSDAFCLFFLAEYSDQNFLYWVVQGGESGQLCLVSVLGEKTFILSSLSMLAVCLSFMVFIVLRCVPFYLFCQKFKIINFVTCLFASIKEIFLLSMNMFHNDSFEYVEPYLHPKSYLIMVNDLVNVLLNQFASSLLRIFASVFIRDIGLQISVSILY